MPKRAILCPPNVSLYSAVMWIAFDSFDGPVLDDSEREALGLIADGPIWAGMLPARYQRKLSPASADVISALKAGLLTAVGIRASSNERAEVETTIPISFWRDSDLKCGWNTAATQSCRYEGILLQTRQVLTVWPPAKEEVAVPKGAAEGTSEELQLREASAAQVHQAIRSVFDDSEKKGTKAPNINELPKLVLGVLAASGQTTSGNNVKKLAAQPEHLRRRRKPGRTLRSEGQRKVKP